MKYMIHLMVGGDMNSCVIHVVHIVIYPIQISTGSVVHRFSVWIIHYVYTPVICSFSHAKKYLQEGRSCNSHSQYIDLVQPFPRDIHTIHW